MLRQQLRDELKQSMLSKNVEKTSILRLLLSAVKYYEIQKGGAGYEATDEDILSVIQKEIKQRRDSIEQYSAAHRKDLADKELHEMELLQHYLPAQLSETEIESLVKEVISQTNAKSIQDMGKVMGILSSKTKGKADGSIVSKIVREQLFKN